MLRVHVRDVLDGGVEGHYMLLSCFLHILTERSVSRTKKPTPLPTPTHVAAVVFAGRTSTATAAVAPAEHNAAMKISDRSVSTYPIKGNLT